MSAIETLNNGPHRNIFSSEHGEVLCVERNVSWFQGLYQASGEAGLTLSKARHGMHGYWVAMSQAPRAIVTDLPNPELGEDFLLECLANNAKTRDIPLIILCRKACDLQKVYPRLNITVVESTIGSKDLTGVIEQSIAAAAAKTTVSIDDTHTDAIFSEFGSQALPFFETGGVYHRADQAATSKVPSRTAVAPHARHRTGV